MIGAVVFDLDGVLIDTEEIWDEVRERYAHEVGAAYGPADQRAMMGMSAPEWTVYMEGLGVPGPPAAINDEVVRRLAERYRAEPPLIDGAVDAVARMAAAGYTLAVASSSNRVLIELVLELAGIADRFAAVVSSEEVARGKPSPDVYLEACRRAGVEPPHAAAIEDSHVGIRSAKSAGLRVLAIPNHVFPPGPEALALADLVLPDLAALTPAAVQGATA